MSHLKIFFILWFIPVWVCANPSSWALGKYANSDSGHYENDVYQEKLLKIPAAQGLEVTLEGKIENCCQTLANENVAKCCQRLKNKRCCDFIIIRDESNQEHIFTGQIQEKFEVIGASIVVIFKSDNSTTDEGFRVSIAPRLIVDVFNDIKSQLLTVLDTILKQGTREIYAKLTEHLKQLETLNSKVKDSQQVEEVLKEVVNALITLGQIYQHSAEQREKIVNLYQEQLKIIKNLRIKTNYKIASIKKELIGYSVQLKKTQVKLSKMTVEVDKQEVQLSLDSYQKHVQMLNLQESVWQHFYELQTSLEIKLQEHLKKIEILLYFLKISGKIYIQAANVAMLRDMTVTAFDKLTDLTKLQKIVTDISRSEQEIQQDAERIKRANVYEVD